MKKTKRIIAVVMSLVLILACCPIAVSADTPTPYMNNTMGTSTGFSINSAGKANITVAYSGIPGITTGAKITSYIERKSGSSWIRVPNGTSYNIWIDNPTSTSFATEHSTTVTIRGEYRAVITYNIYGSRPTDVVDEIIYRTY